MKPEHDQALAAAFDGQAERFEVAPVQSDPAALARLAAFAGLPDASRVLDAGCGPGLVSEAFLKAGHSVFGVDLSAEMVARAIKRGGPFGERARFLQGSLYDEIPGAPFDAAVSRYVLHHMTDPLAFITRQIALIRPGGTLVISDHSTDTDLNFADRHEILERLRDRTHTRNLTTGGLVDLLASAGLSQIRAEEELFTLDFDEWFDRGTPADSKANARKRLLEGPSIRGFSATLNDDGSVRIGCVRALVRGIKP